MAVSSFRSKSELIVAERMYAALDMLFGLNEPEFRNFKAPDNRRVTLGSRAGSVFGARLVAGRSGWHPEEIEVFTMALRGDPSVKTQNTQQEGHTVHIGGRNRRRAKILGVLCIQQRRAAGGEVVWLRLWAETTFGGDTLRIQDMLEFDAEQLAIGQPRGEGSGEPHYLEPALAKDLFLGGKLIVAAHAVLESSVLPPANE